jgi:hypothetical protein
LISVTRTSEKRLDRGPAAGHGRARGLCVQRFDQLERRVNRAKVSQVVELILTLKRMNLDRECLLADRAFLSLTHN